VLDLKRAGAPALELATAIAHAFGKPDDQNFIARIASGVYRADKAELRDWLYAARHPSARSPAAVFIRRVEGRPPT
jgi:hypothetical protein